MRIAIYARKSTESEDRQVQSLEDQIKALRYLAQREGLPEPEVFQESRSALKPRNRPEFDRLMHAISKGEINGILTWSINRLSRNDLEGGIVGQFLRDGDLLFIRTPERTYSPDDNALLFAVENGMAIAYSQDLRRNVIRGMKGKVERGWTCSKAPIGYLNDAETREIKVDPDRFHLVRHGWELLLSGQPSVNAIHRELSARGLTVSSRKGRYHTLSRARLHTVFRQRFYMGEIVFKGQIYPGKHEPMISPEEFERAQRLLSRTNSAQASKSKIGFAFGAALVCSQCGCRIVGERRIKNYPKTGRTATYIYYHCSGHRGCSKKAIREEALASAVAQPLSYARLDKDTAQWLKLSLVECVERDAHKSADNASQLQRELDQADLRLKNLTMLRLDQEIDSDEYHGMRSEIVARRSAILERLDSIRQISSRVVEWVYERIDAAVQAGQLLGGDHDATALGHVLRAGGNHRLNLEDPSFELDPVLQKITAFEPLRDGSLRPKPGDLLPLNSSWWALVDDLRTISEQMLVASSRDGVKGVVAENRANQRKSRTAEKADRIGQKVE